MKKSEEDDLAAFCGIALGTILGILFWAIIVLSAVLIWWPTGEGVPFMRMP